MCPLLIPGSWRENTKILPILPVVVYVICGIKGLLVAMVTCLVEVFNLEILCVATGHCDESEWNDIVTSVGNLEWKKLMSDNTCLSVDFSLF